MLTQDHFKRFKDDYAVYAKSVQTGTYGETSVVKVRKGTIECMWHPVTDEGAVAEYGERVSRMLEAVLYEGDVSELDVIIVNREDYEVRAVLPFNTHRLIRVEKIEPIPILDTGEGAR